MLANVSQHLDVFDNIVVIALFSRCQACLFHTCVCWHLKAREQSCAVFNTRSHTGTSNNNTNNNTERERHSANVNNSEAVAPMDVFVRKQTEEDNSDEDTDVQTVPLLFMGGQSSRDDDSVEWGDMEEDEV